MTEEEKMTNGMIYDGTDDVLLSKREKTHKLCRIFNQIEDDSSKKEMK